MPLGMRGGMGRWNAKAKMQIEKCKIVGVRGTMWNAGGGDGATRRVDCFPDTSYRNGKYLTRFSHSSAERH